MSTHLESSKRKRSARARWSISSACSSSSARSSGEGVNFSICSTMSTGNWSRPSIVMIALNCNRIYKWMMLLALTSIQRLVLILKFWMLYSWELRGCHCDAQHLTLEHDCYEIASVGSVIRPAADYFASFFILQIWYWKWWGTRSLDVKFSVMTAKILGPEKVSF